MAYLFDCDLRVSGDTQRLFDSIKVYDNLIVMYRRVRFGAAKVGFRSRSLIHAVVFLNSHSQHFELNGQERIRN